MPHPDEPGPHLKWLCPQKPLSHHLLCGEGFEHCFLAAVTASGQKKRVFWAGIHCFFAFQPWPDEVNLGMHRKLLLGALAVTPGWGCPETHRVTFAENFLSTGLFKFERASSHDSRLQLFSQAQAVRGTMCLGFFFRESFWRVPFFRNSEHILGRAAQAQGGGP